MMRHHDYARMAEPMYQLEIASRGVTVTLPAT